MGLCLLPHGQVKHAVYAFNLLSVGSQVKCNLSIELGHKVGVNGEVPWSPQESLVNQHLKRISLEQLQELFTHLPRHNLPLSPDPLVLGCPLLEVPPFSLLGPSLSGSLHSLGLHQLTLLQLQEHLLMLSQLDHLIVLNDLNLRILKRLSHQDLEYGFNLQLEVKQVSISIVDLNLLVFSFVMGQEVRRRLFK